VPLLIAPLFFLAAGLLVVAGLDKARRPRPTAQALYSVGLPGSASAVRGLGAVEIAAGTAALIAPAPWSALAIAALYSAFGGFVVFLLLAHPTSSSCGCAGSKETPPSWLHVGINIVFAAVAAGVAVVGTPSMPEAVSVLGLAAVPASVGLVMAGWLVMVVEGEVPAASRAWTPPTHHERELFDHPDRHRRADVALTTAGVDKGHPSLWPDHDPATGLPLEGADVGH
jgi:hypothetical protein